MKILLMVSTLRKPNPSWHLMKALIEDLLDAGIEIHAIQRCPVNAQLPAFPDTIINHHNFSYSEVPSAVVEKTKFIKRYLHSVSETFKFCHHIKKHNDFDIVFLQSSFVSFFALYIARHYAKKRPVIFNNQDMFPGSAISNGSMPQKWMQKIFYAMQKRAYKKATYITAISEDMKNKLLEQGVPNEKIGVIVNWYDDSAVHEVEWDNNRFVKEYGLDKNTFFVQYAGTMGTNFNPEIVLEVAELLRPYPNIEFQMIGEGVRKADFEEDAKRRNLTNIVFYPLQPQELVSDVYSACSVCLIPLKEGVIGNSVPSKAGLLMACRRVIVNSVDEGSDYSEMFERERIGFSAGVHDAEKIANIIRYLYENSDVLDQYATRAKEFGKREYSSKVNTAKYIELFREMVR